MKLQSLLAALFALCIAGSAGAQSGAIHKAAGVVTKVDKDKVTIKHGPVPTIQWPAMTMAFKVKDKALTDKLKPNSRVEFEFRQEGNDYVVTSVR
jgi:Cu(I)/Ag(I) efflux system periplasmic protein CusF